MFLINDVKRIRLNSCQILWDLTIFLFDYLREFSKFRCFHDQFLLQLSQLMTTQQHGELNYLNKSTLTVYLDVIGSSLITWPTMGLLQAPHTPLATVWTPSRLRSDCRLPSMLSSLLAGLGGPVGEVFPWDWICWRTRRTKEASAEQWCR